MSARTTLLTSALAIALVMTGGVAAQADSGAAVATGTGCTNTATIPVGAVTGPISDVDQDGRPDTQFYGAGDGRYIYGIRTSAGGVYAITDPLRGLRPHSGFTAYLDGSGFVSVIDDTETAKLYAFRDCRFVQPQHKTGGAYTFTLGAKSTTGTGIACNDQNGGPILMRSTAKKRANGRYDIVWSVIRVSEDGRTAYRQGGSGSTDVRWSNLKASDTRVRDARASHCLGVVKKVTASTE
jgi:hypothetical protein